MGLVAGIGEVREHMKAIFGAGDEGLDPELVTNYAQREFGIVRMGGTVGWIAASWPLIFLLSDQPDAARWTYIVSGVASLIPSGR